MEWKVKVMTRVQHFNFDGYHLTLRPESYLILVRPVMEKPEKPSSITELPDWVFHSRLAIWLTDDITSMHERSIRGESLRRVFFSRYVRARSVAG